jgi:FkbM family methyltransferase
MAKPLLPSRATAWLLSGFRADMNFDNPAWRAAPLRTAIRVAKSLVRRVVPDLSQVIVAYDGGRSSIHADLRTPLGLGLYRYGLGDSDVDLVGRLLEPGDTFVDGGAHVGLFTLVAAARVGKEGRVLSFEPTTATRNRLAKNVELNAFRNVEIVPAALSSEVGQAEFRVFDVVGSGLNHLGPVGEEGGKLETVAVTTLDAALSDRHCGRIALVKLDLEGAEQAALLGARRTLSEFRPDLLLEIEPAHLARLGASPEGIEALLRPHGYAFFRIDTGSGGAPELSQVTELHRVAPRPNVFATTRPERLREKGLVVP